MKILVTNPLFSVIMASWQKTLKKEEKRIESGITGIERRFSHNVRSGDKKILSLIRRERKNTAETTKKKLLLTVVPILKKEKRKLKEYWEAFVVGVALTTRRLCKFTTKSQRQKPGDWTSWLRGMTYQKWNWYVPTVTPLNTTYFIKLTI